VVLSREADKDDERGWGWEFSETNLKYAIKFLEEEGYIKE
jgi:DNA-binding PadR family transcriptional regulator